MEKVKKNLYFQTFLFYLLAVSFLMVYDARVQGDNHRLSLGQLTVLPKDNYNWIQVHPPHARF